VLLLLPACASPRAAERCLVARALPHLCDRVAGAVHDEVLLVEVDLTLHLRTSAGAGEAGRFQGKVRAGSGHVQEDSRMSRQLQSASEYYSK